MFHKLASILPCFSHISRKIKHFFRSITFCNMTRLEQKSKNTYNILLLIFSKSVIKN